VKIPFYNLTRAGIDEVKADPDEVFVHLEVGPLGYRGLYSVPFADFCELVRAQINKPTKKVKVEA
jgi:hypothetical protein